MKLMIDLMRARNQPPTGRASRAFTLIELLVVVVIIGILAALLLAVLGRTKVKAENAVCVNNLRQLGIAVRTYVGDDNERLPSAERLPTQPANPQEPLPRICDLLARYTGQTAGNSNTVSVCKCPMDKNNLFATEGSSYEWNTSLNGHRIDEAQPPLTFQETLTSRTKGPNGGPISRTTTNVVLRFTPETTPLLFDYKDSHPRSGKSGKNAVFMDGHVAPDSGQVLKRRVHRVS
jgi:prepilin-type N-terminal cleavage/methylation domain-containing protein/prepilin-type processing-associated H-X9-DG protein